MRRAIVFLALLSLLVAACSGPSGDPGGVPGSPTDSTPFSPTDSTPFSAVGDGRVSPLVRFFDAAEGDDSDETVKLQASRIYVDTLVRCMSEQGFEYFIDPVARLYGTAEPDPPGDPDGFGLAVPLPDQGVVTSDGLEAKNASYVASLTPEARSEYYIALLGFDPSLPPGSEGGPPIADPDQPDSLGSVLGGQGCEGEAGLASEEYLMAQRQEEAPGAALEARLQELLDEYVAEVETDPGILAALGDYQACMTKAGFSIGRPESALSLVYEGPVDLVGLLAADGADILDRLQAGDATLDDPDVKAFRAREVEARSTFQRCSSGVVDTLFAFDRRFLDEHRDVLGQYDPDTG